MENDADGVHLPGSIAHHGCRAGIAREAMDEGGWEKIGNRTDIMRPITPCDAIALFVLVDINRFPVRSRGIWRVLRRDRASCVHPHEAFHRQQVRPRGTDIQA